MNAGRRAGYHLCFPTCLLCRTLCVSVLPSFTLPFVFPYLPPFPLPFVFPAPPSFTPTPLLCVPLPPAFHPRPSSSRLGRSSPRRRANTFSTISSLTSAATSAQFLVLSSRFLGLNSLTHIPPVISSTATPSSVII